jgi:hypothetical protein
LAAGPWQRHRESDIYALFSRRPLTVHLLVRVAQSRQLGDGIMLFAVADDWPVPSPYTVQVPKWGPGDAGCAAKWFMTPLQEQHDGNQPEHQLRADHKR